MAVPLNVPTLLVYSAEEWAHRVKTAFAEKPNARRALVTSAAVMAGLFILKRMTAANRT